MPRHRLGGWALVVSVLACWLVAVVVPGGRLPSDDSEATATLAGTGAPVVLVGIPGLTWDLVDPTATPTLARLAEEGASAALVPRGTHEVTCPADAWLSLGAGQRAGTDLDGCGDRQAGDRSATPAEVVGAEQVEPGRWHAWQEAAERRALGPELGTLARVLHRAGTCVASYGPAAGIAAADPSGALAHHSPEGLDAAVRGLDPQCRVHLVEAPAPATVSGDEEATSDGAATTAAGGGLADLGTIDAQLADLLSTMPSDTRVIVAGLGTTTGTVGATVLVTARTAAGGDEGTGAGTGLGTGAGAGPLSLSSDSTRQAGLVQLTDLTAALLDAAGAGPDDAVAGGLVRQVLVPDAPEHAAGLATGVSEAKRLAPWALGWLSAVLLPALGVTAALRRRRALAVVATVAMAVPVSTFLAGLLPWWSAGRPLPALVMAVLVIAVLVAAVAWAGPWRSRALGPPAVVAAVTLAVLGADVLRSSRLGLVSILGLQPVTAGRFYGQGNVGFGIVLGAFLVIGAVLLSRLPHREAALAVLLLGTATVLVGAAPQAGADFGGVPGMVLATGLLVLSALGLRWRPRTLVVLGLVGALVAGTVMVADWARGPERRTHLGGFVQDVLEGEAAAVVARKLDQSLGILVSYPLSWLAVIALVLVTTLAATRRPAWTAPLWSPPGLRPAVLAGLVAMAATWALNDSGIAAVALTLALLIATAIVVLAADAEDRHQPTGPLRRQEG